MFLPILRLLNSAAVLYDARRNRHNGHHFGLPTKSIVLVILS